MEYHFYCNNCDKIFPAEPNRKEYIDPVFGPCTTLTAKCPDCNADCSEYRKPKPKAVKKILQGPSCSDGSCSCFN
jgi:hypothetical protein